MTAQSGQCRRQMSGHCAHPDGPRRHQRPRRELCDPLRYARRPALGAGGDQRWADTCNHVRPQQCLGMPQQPVPPRIPSRTGRAVPTSRPVPNPSPSPARRHSDRPAVERRSLPL
jgi:hypothetical protein